MAKKNAGKPFRAPRDIQHKGKTYRKGEMMPAKYRRYFSTPNDQANPRRTDKAAGLDAVPPNFGRFVMPQVQTFQGMMSSISHSYLNPDEAIKHCPENALKMERDCFVMECIQARQRGVALLNWHIEPEDSRDEKQKEIADIVTGILQQIPNFMEMRRQLLEAVWYGRYAVQTRWGMVKRMGKKYWGIVGSKPIHGDKLAFRYDDGSGEYDENQIGIRVTGARMKDDVLQGKRKLEATTWGMAYFLEDWERALVILHKHMIRDAAFEDYISSGSINGVGIRSFIYWTWLQMSECMAFLLEYIERTGQGIWIYYYPSGNDQAKQEVETTAEQANRSNVILMPRMSGDPALDAFGIERIDPSPQGAENLKTVIHEFFGHRIKRYVLGQTLSSESDSTGLGSGVADLQYNSYFEIIKYDATNLEETITQEIVKQIIEKNFPEWTDYHFKFKIDTESAEKEKKLASFRQAYDMGARIREADVMDAIGLGAPQDGDVVLQNPTIRQQERLWQQQMQQDGMGGGGMPGMDGGMGDPNGGPGGGPGGDPNQPAPNNPTGPNGEDLGDLFGPLANGAINGVAQGSGTQWQMQPYSKTGEKKPAPTTPDTGKPTTKEQGNSNPIPAPPGAAPAGASTPPGSKPPSGGANAESAAPPSLPKPPKMPGSNPSGAGAGGNPVGTNDAPAGTAEIGKEAKPTGALPSLQNPNAAPVNAGPAPTPGPNPAAAPAQGQQQTQGQAYQNQNQNPPAQARQNNPQQPAAQPQQQPWNTPEFRAAQPQRQQFVAQHFQKAVKSRAMPPSVGGMFRAMMASPNFQSNAEYITHDFAPQQAESIHRELAAQAGRQYGGGLVADLSATHGPGAIGYSSPAGAVVITPPTQPGGKWLTHYSANTGVVQRAMSGQPAFGQSNGMMAQPAQQPAAQQQAGAIDERQLAQFDTGKSTGQKIRGNLNVMAAQDINADAVARAEANPPPIAGQERFEDIEAEPTNPRQFQDTAEGLRAKKAALLDQQLRKFEAGNLSDDENARYDRQLSMIDAQIKNAGESAKHHEPIYQGWQDRRAAWQQKRDADAAKASETKQPAAPQKTQDELLNPTAIRDQHATLLAEWKQKADAGELDRRSNAQYKTRVSALKDQLKNAETIAKSKEPPKKSLKDRQAEITQARRESDENFNRTGKTVDGKDFHTLTRAEFASETGLPIEQHKKWIKDAIGRGADIPQNVAAEYPEIVRSENEKRERQSALTEVAKTRAERIKSGGSGAGGTGGAGPGGRQQTAAEKKEREPYVTFLKNQGGMTEEDLAGMGLAALKAKREEVAKANQEKLRSEESARKQKERGDIQGKEAHAKQRREQIAAKLPADVREKLNAIAASWSPREYTEDDHHKFVKSSDAFHERALEALAAYASRGADTAELDRIVQQAGRSTNRNTTWLSSVSHEIDQAERRQQNAEMYGGFDNSTPDQRIDKFAQDNNVDSAKLRSAINEVRKTVIGKKPNREDPETLTRALKLMKEQAAPADSYKESDDFWDAFDGGASEPPQNVQPGPPAREAGDEDGEPADVADPVSQIEDAARKISASTGRRMVKAKALRDALPNLSPEEFNKAFMQVSQDFVHSPYYGGEVRDTEEERAAHVPNGKQPGMAYLTVLNNSATPKKPARDSSPVPFRKSSESAERIKYMRSQRPDLFAI